MWFKIIKSEGDPVFVVVSKEVRELWTLSVKISQESSTRMIGTESPDRWVLWFQICKYYHRLTLSHFNALLKVWLIYLRLGEGNRPEELKLKVAQSCPKVGGPMDSTVHGILQARILQGVAFPYSKGLPNPGIKPRHPTLKVDSLPAEPQGSQRMLEWVVYPFSTKASLPRNWTDVYSFAGRIFPKWAIQKVLRWTKSGG